MGSALISARALADILSDVVVIDASWHMPNAGRDARAEFAREHIAGARFFDLDAVSDKASPFPHMLPSAADFQDSIRPLCISNDSDVVVYDTQGIFSAPRLWWMLRVFGHTRVRVLDGGLPAWKREFSVTDEPTHPVSGSFTAKYHPERVLLRDEVAVTTTQICDARSALRFLGREPEPRAGVRSGHIPASKNVHYATLLDAQGGMLPHERLRRVFADAGVDIAAPVIASCGSGVTACIIALALYELGYPDVPVYDGSWAEWGASELPVEL